MITIPLQLLSSAPDTEVLDLASKVSLAKECDSSDFVNLRGSPRQSSAGNWREGAGGAGKAGETEWQAEQSMGLPVDESSNGVGHSELSILSNQELAEIYEWMERCDNRTDELRLLGTGVVPATATLAFKTLLAEILNE